MTSFFAELQRRNVYKVAVAYAVVSWLLIQIATQVFPFFEIPAWGIRLVVVLLLFGFPIALLFAWVFELTPEGLKRSVEVDPEKSITRRTARKLDFVIIGVLVTVIAALVFTRNRSGPPEESAPLKSIAVLPFENLSEDKSNAYFADGIQDEILTRLGKIADLKVISRTSTQRYRGASPNLAEIGRQLGVANILVGSVQKAANEVRVNVQLIDVLNDRTRWGETYARKLIDVFDVESEVAQRVAEALDARLTGRERERVANRPTGSEAAYDAYLRGRYFLDKRTPEAIRKGLVLFQQAVAEDPKFALGHAGIADSYILLGKIGAMRGDEAAERAWPEVSSALFIDDQLAQGYISRAILLNDFEWNWPAAEVDYRKALELDSNNAAAHHWFARHLEQLGRSEEALHEIAAALKNDPLSPTIRVAQGNIFFVAHRYQEAVDPCKKALELEPNFASAYQVLGQVYTHLGQSAEAVEAARKYVELSAGSGWSMLELAYAHAVAGNRAESDKIVNEVTARPGEFSPYDLATIRSAWRDAAGAMPWLERAIEQRSVDVILIRVDPRLDNVRSDPRFKEILARVVPRRNFTQR